MVPGGRRCATSCVRSFEEGEGKAALAGAVGAESGLESERRHLFVTVPLGFLRGFGELLRGDAYGPLRSLALVAGIAAAARRLPGRRAAPAAPASRSVLRPGLGSPPWKRARANRFALSLLVAAVGVLLCSLGNALARSGRGAGDGRSTSSACW